MWIITQFVILILKTTGLSLRSLLFSQKKSRPLLVLIYTLWISTRHTLLLFHSCSHFVCLFCRPTLRLKVSTTVKTALLKPSFPAKLGFMIGRNGLKASYLISGEYIWTARVVLVKVSFNDNQHHCMDAHAFI